MGEQADNLIKVREISFSTLHPDSQQAHSAAALLVDVEGVTQVEIDGDAALRVEYHLLQVSLAEIESLLESEGFHLDNRLVHKVRRALYRYTEETQRANLGCEAGDANCTQKVFATSYKRRDHGCRDDRPEHWRRYL
jgi:hypothetical protein